MSNRDSIILNATPLEKGPCIYFLINKGEIVYVGQSTSVHFRIHEHTKDKTFDSYFIEHCPREEMNNLEASYIVKFQPTYNFNLPPNELYKGIAYLKERFGMGAWELKRFLKRNKIRPVALDYYFDFKEVQGAIQHEKSQ